MLITCEVANDMGKCPHVPLFSIHMLKYSSHVTFLQRGFNQETIRRFFFLTLSRLLFSHLHFFTSHVTHAHFTCGKLSLYMKIMSLVNMSTCVYNFILILKCCANSQSDVKMCDNVEFTCGEACFT